MSFPTSFTLLTQHSFLTTSRISNLSILYIILIFLTFYLKYPRYSPEIPQARLMKLSISAHMAITRIFKDNNKLTPLHSRSLSGRQAQRATRLPGKSVVLLLLRLVSVIQIAFKIFSSITSNNSFIFCFIPPLVFHAAICSQHYAPVWCAWRMESCSSSQCWQGSLRASLSSSIYKKSISTFVL